MHFSFYNTPVMFQWLMETVLKGLMSRFLCVWTMWSWLATCSRYTWKTYRECSNDLEVHLKIHLEKYQLSETEVRCPGHIVSAKGVNTDPENLNVTWKWPTLRYKHELRSFLGLCTYYILSPNKDNTKTKNSARVCSKKQRDGFSVSQDTILSQFRGVTIDRVWIGEGIYWPLIHTTRNYKRLKCYRWFPHFKITTAPAKPFPACSLFTSCSLVMTSSSGDSSASRAQILLPQPPMRNSCQISTEL
jgi:hypothetical protein